MKVKVCGFEGWVQAYYALWRRWPGKEFGGVVKQCGILGIAAVLEIGSSFFKNLIKRDMNIRLET
jgi:hypothetical protein